MASSSNREISGNAGYAYRVSECQDSEIIKEVNTIKGVRFLAGNQPIVLLSPSSDYDCIEPGRNESTAPMKDVLARIRALQQAEGEQKENKIIYLVAQALCRDYYTSDLVASQVPPVLGWVTKKVVEHVTYYTGGAVISQFQKRNHWTCLVIRGDEALLVDSNSDGRGYDFAYHLGLLKQFNFSSQGSLKDFLKSKGLPEADKDNVIYLNWQKDTFRCGKYEAEFERRLVLCVAAHQPFDMSAPDPAVLDSCYDKFYKQYQEAAKKIEDISEAKTQWDGSDDEDEISSPSDNDIKIKIEISENNHIPQPLLQLEEMAVVLVEGGQISPRDGDHSPASQLNTNESSPASLSDTGNSESSDASKSSGSISIESENRLSLSGQGNRSDSGYVSPPSSSSSPMAVGISSLSPISPVAFSPRRMRSIVDRVSDMNPHNRVDLAIAFDIPFVSPSIAFSELQYAALQEGEDRDVIYDGEEVPNFSLQSPVRKLKRPGSTIDLSCQSSEQSTRRPFRSRSKSLSDLRDPIVADTKDTNTNSLPSSPFTLSADDVEDVFSPIDNNAPPSIDPQRIFVRDFLVGLSFGIFAGVLFILNPPAFAALGVKSFVGYVGGSTAVASGVGGTAGGLLGAFLGRVVNYCSSGRVTSPSIRELWWLDMNPDDSSPHGNSGSSRDNSPRQGSSTACIAPQVGGVRRPQPVQQSQQARGVPLQPSISNAPVVAPPRKGFRPRF